MSEHEEQGGGTVEDATDTVAEKADEAKETVAEKFEDAKEAVHDKVVEVKAKREQKKEDEEKAPHWSTGGTQIV